MYWSSRKLAISQILTTLEFSSRIFENYANIEYHENPSSGSRVVSCGQTNLIVDIVARLRTGLPRNRYQKSSRIIYIARF